MNEMLRATWSGPDGRLVAPPSQPSDTPSRAGAPFVSGTNRMSRDRQPRPLPRPPRTWCDIRQLRVLGMGTALPGPPVSTAQLPERLEQRFGVALSRPGTCVAEKLRIETRHLCRDFAARHEGPRPGHSNPDLAAAALRAALAE